MSRSKKKKTSKVMKLQSFNDELEKFNTPYIQGCYTPHGGKALEEIAVTIMRQAGELHRRAYTIIIQSKDWLIGKDGANDWIRLLKEEISLQMGGTNLYLHTFEEYLEWCVVHKKHIRIVGDGHRVPEMEYKGWFNLLCNIKKWNKLLKEEEAES